MTALGKLTVLFVFLLSLVWFAMVVMLFTTRHNWKVEAEKAQKANRSMADANSELQDLLRNERKANEDADRAYRASNERLKQMNDKLLADYASLEKAFRSNLADQRGKEAQEKGVTARETTLQDEIKAKTEIIQKYEISLDTMNRDMQKAMNERDDARREENLQKRRAEQYADQVRSLSDLVAEYKQQGVALKGNVRPVAPEGFRGTVQTVSGSLVEFTPGSNTGLRANTKLTVYRPSKQDTQARWIGYIYVTDQIDPDKSVGVFELPFTVKKPVASDMPQRGDLIIPTSTR